MPSETPSTLYELMFDSTKKLTARLTDAADLMIDFATLGEYGLEPAGRPRQGCADPSPTSTPGSNPRRAPGRTAAPTRTATIGRTATRRDTTCNLLQEAGFLSPRHELSR
jgi:hypothetical protein